MWPSCECIVASRSCANVSSMKPPLRMIATTPETMTLSVSAVRARCRNRLRAASFSNQGTSMRYSHAPTLAVMPQCIDDFEARCTPGGIQARQRGGHKAERECACGQSPRQQNLRGVFPLPARWRRHGDAEERDDLRKNESDQQTKQRPQKTE